MARRILYHLGIVKSMVILGFLKNNIFYDIIVLLTFLENGLIGSLGIMLKAKHLYNQVLKHVITLYTYLLLFLCLRDEKIFWNAITLY